VVRTIAARPISIGCQRNPIAAVEVAAIHEYTENSRYCSSAARLSGVMPRASRPERQWLAHRQLISRRRVQACFYDAHPDVSEECTLLGCERLQLDEQRLWESSGRTQPYAGAAGRSRVCVEDVDAADRHVQYLTEPRRRELIDRAGMAGRLRLNCLDQTA
jgi:hypothetical protein